MEVEYKRGFKLKLEDGTVISIIKPQRGLYQVVGFYGEDYPEKYLELFSSRQYASLSGCAAYLEKYFDIELI